MRDIGLLDCDFCREAGSPVLAVRGASSARLQKPALSRPEFSDSDPISAIGDHHLGVTVTEIAVEVARVVVPPHAITDAPLRHDPGTQRFWLALRGSPPGRGLLPVIVETSQVARFRPRDLRPFAPRPNPSFFANVDRASEYAGAVSG